MRIFWWTSAALLLLPLSAFPVDSTSQAAAQPKRLASASRPVAADSAKHEFNKSEIQGLYLAGDFEALAALLENLRYEHRLRDREDSIFIYKYLGVIYGADETTRKKAETFLYDMLKLDPKANLTDLAVGMNVESLFDKARKRYKQNYHDTTFDQQKQIILRQWAADSTRRDSVGQAAAHKASAPATPATAPWRDHPWVWIAAGSAAALATVGIILIASGGSSSSQVDTILTPIK